MATITGTANSDFVHLNDGTDPPGYNNLPLATEQGDIFNGGQGGTDLIRLAGGSDIANFGSDFTAADSVDGGSGAPGELDELVFNGAVSANLGAASMTNIEIVRFLSFPVQQGTFALHHLTLDEANVGVSADFQAIGNTLPDYIGLEFDFSADTDAHSFTVSGGAAGDTIKGRAGNNAFFDRIDLSTGGNDTVISAGTMNFGATFDAQDSVDGLGNGRVRLYGDYAARLDLTAGMTKNLSSFVLGAEGGGGTAYDYNLRLLANSLSPSQSFIGFICGGVAGTATTIDATALPAGKGIAVNGGASNDTVYGSDQGDNFDLFGFGADTYYANGGDDEFRTSVQFGGDDFVNGGSGTDTMYVSATPVVSILYDGTRIDSIERIVANAASVGLTLTVTDVIGAGETLTIDWSPVTDAAKILKLDATGATGAILATGGAGNDLLVAGAGGDTLDGRGGVDDLWGNGGNDTYLNPAGDIIHEADGGGVDTVKTITSFSLANAPYVERLILSGGANINGIGSTRADTITGNEGANILNGGGGNDTLYGRGGADTLNGGQGDDTYLNPVIGTDAIVEAAGAAGGLHDRIQSDTSISLAAFANIEDATLTGTAAVNINGNNGANTLFGNSAANIINGGGGRDVLFGGGGDDRMDGGQGADFFSFSDTANGTDRIFNFETARDRFVLGDLFTARIESNGDTTLFHGGGKIVIQDITGLNLAQWNALVTFATRVHDTHHHDAAALDYL